MLCLKSHCIYQKGSDQTEFIRDGTGNETFVFCLLHISVMRQATSVLASMEQVNGESPGTERL